MASVLLFSVGALAGKDNTGWWITPPPHTHTSPSASFHDTALPPRASADTTLAAALHCDSAAWPPLGIKGMEWWRYVECLLQRPAFLFYFIFDLRLLHPINTHCHSIVCVSLLDHYVFKAPEITRQTACACFNPPTDKNNVIIICSQSHKLQCVDEQVKWPWDELIFLSHGHNHGRGWTHT